MKTFCLMAAAVLLAGTAQAGNGCCCAVSGAAPAAGAPVAAAPAAGAPVQVAQNGQGYRSFSFEPAAAAAPALSTGPAFSAPVSSSRVYSAPRRNSAIVNGSYRTRNQFN